MNFLSKIFKNEVGIMYDISFNNREIIIFILNVICISRFGSNEISFITTDMFNIGHLIK